MTTDFAVCCHQSGNGSFKRLCSITDSFLFNLH